MADANFKVLPYEATNPREISLVVNNILNGKINSTGSFTCTATATTTRAIKPGRYVWDMLVSSGSTIYRLVEGNVLVLGGISSAP